MKPWHATQVPNGGWIVVKEDEEHFALSSRGWTSRLGGLNRIVKPSAEEALKEAQEMFGHAALFLGTTDPSIPTTWLPFGSD